MLNNESDRNLHIFKEIILQAYIAKFYDKLMFHQKLR